MGGIDWSGLDLVVAKYGIEDVDGLIDRLYILRTHQSPRKNEAQPREE